MSMLQSWSGMIDETVKAQFMQSKLWESVPQGKDWEAAVVDPVLIEVVITKLTEDELGVLEHLLSGLLLREQQEEIVVEQLSEKLSRPKRNCRIALHSLAQGGIIVCFQHPWQGKFLLMPLPIFQSWREVLKKRQVGTDVTHVLETANSHVQQVVESDGSDLQQLDSSYDQLPIQLVQHCQYAHAVPLSLTFLLFINELNCHQLTFTKQGELSKKLVKQLHKQLESYADVTALRQLWQIWFAKEEAIDRDAAVKLMLELAYDLDLLERNAREFTISGSKLRQWLMLTQQSQDDIIWQWLLQHIVGSLDERITATESLLSQSLLFMIDLLNSKGNWISFLPECDQGSVHSEDVKLLLQLLDILRHCGLISFAVDRDMGDEVNAVMRSIFAKRELAAERQDQVHLEPNGEMFILPGTFPLLIWQTIEVAELNVVQETVQLRVTVQSLKRCLESGHTHEQLRRWLEHTSSGMLPGLIIAMLEQAFSESNLEKDGDRSGKVVIPLHIGVSNGKDNVYSPLPISAWGCFSINPLGKLSEGELLTPLQWNDQLRIEDITRSWRSELRRYHSSTMQQIVDISLQYGLSLVVQLAGKVFSIVPIAMEERAGTWTVTAKMYAQPTLPSLQISLDRIEAIQLDGVEGKGA